MGSGPSELDASVTSRIPIRTDRNDCYFDDAYQVMPLHGYTAMFERMLDHPNIRVELHTDYQDLSDAERCQDLIYTGPIDAYFDYRFGRCRTAH